MNGTRKGKEVILSEAALSQKLSSIDEMLRELLFVTQKTREQKENPGKGAIGPTCLQGRSGGNPGTSSKEEISVEGECGIQHSVPAFNGRMDGESYSDWLQAIEQQFRGVLLTEEQKVKLATTNF